MDCLLFDVDGTLVNSRNLMIQSLAAVVKQKAGETLNIEDLKTRVEISPKAILDPYGLSLESYWRSYMKHLHLAVLFDEQTVAVLKELRERGVKLGVVSDLKKTSLDRLLKQTGLHDYFEVIYGWSLHYKKPNPGQINKALQVLGVSPDRAAYIGDLDKDMQAANKAGVQPVKVAWSLANIDDNIPHLVVNSLSDLLTLQVPQNG